MDNPGFHFEIHVANISSSNSITAELRVITKRELNGARVECSGSSGSIMYMIQVGGEFYYSSM